jgi:hypothetical protein
LIDKKMVVNDPLNPSCRAESKGASSKLRGIDFDKLNAYLNTRQDLHDDAPLFTNRANNPLAEQDVFRVCERLSN